MRIYISGKMRGLPEEESRNLFKAAEQYLIELGHDVVNPWDTEDEKKQLCKDWDDYILYDLPILKTCDAIFMLQNWQFSDGAQIEYHFARGRHMEIIYEVPPILSDKEYLDRAIDLIIQLTEDDPSFMCEKLHNYKKENRLCAETCENFDHFCVLRYLKYHKIKAK